MYWGITTLGKGELETQMRGFYEGVEKELPRLTLTRFQQSDLLGRQIIEGIDLRLFTQMSPFYV